VRPLLVLLLLLQPAAGAAGAGASDATAAPAAADLPVARCRNLLNIYMHKYFPAAVNTRYIRIHRL